VVERERQRDRETETERERARERLYGWLASTRLNENDLSSLSLSLREVLVERENIISLSGTREREGEHLSSLYEGY
jgi:hypothetical protein